jgi:uncharacterized protein
MEASPLGVMANSLVDAIRVQVEADFADDNTGHDIAHLDRVYGLAQRLQESEGGNILVLAGASYVHDYHRVLERRSGAYGGGYKRDAVDDLVAVSLQAVDFPAELIRSVCDCVNFTDRYSFSGHALDAPSIEARILRDADNLDALGAIGIARAFMFGGALREPIWVDHTEPAEEYRAGVTTSVVHHFYEKLLRVKDDMLTDAGRALASERHDFMVAFLGQLRDEWELAGLGQSRAPQPR